MWQVGFLSLKKDYGNIVCRKCSFTVEYKVMLFSCLFFGDGVKRVGGSIKGNPGLMDKPNSEAVVIDLFAKLEGVFGCFVLQCHLEVNGPHVVEIIVASCT
jgi:hypothetical protein